MSFKEGIEPAKIKNLIDETEQNVRNFEDVTSKVVEEYTSELDSILNAIKINIVSVVIITNMVNMVFLLYNLKIGNIIT